MKKLVFLLATLLSLPLFASEKYTGIFMTNDQGTQYADTLIECKTGLVISLSGGEKYRKLTNSYLLRDNLNNYGELYVELKLSNYQLIDKIKYYNSHADATAVVIDVLRESNVQNLIDSCRGNS